MTHPVEMVQISVTELADRLQSPEADRLQLLDVREESEAAIAFIPNFKLLPLSAAAEWAEQLPQKLDPHQETIVLCHHGMRSAQMCQWLISQGFTQVKNVRGGIDAYSLQVDATVPRY